MDFKLRTIIVGLISLAAVLAIYLIYTHISETPQIDIAPAKQFIDVIADSDVGDFDREIGAIGDVSIGALTKTVFRHIKNGQVDREIGFKELLHEVRGEWEVEKPYIKIYQPNFKCYVAADRGTLQVENAVGKLNLKDAAFTGNVVLHLLPERGSDIKESFIYLDDVAFVSEKSLLSTTGPVRFVSQGAQMLGQGLELIYNEQLERLELFRIIHLESLRLKSSQTGLFSGNTRHKRRLADMPEMSLAKTETQDQQTIEQSVGEYYKCVLSKNVIIDSSEQMIFAKDDVTINSIFWSRNSGQESDEAEAAGMDTLTTSNTAVSPNTEPGDSTKDINDIVVTCDDGVVLAPENSTREQNKSDALSIETSDLDQIHPKSFDDVTGRPTFVTRRVEYDILTGDAIVPGLSALTFYAVSTADTIRKESAVPVRITAQKEAKFLSASNQVVFQGDCVCTMLRTDPNDVQQKYTLTAPKLTTKLESQTKGQGSRLEHLTADGGVVKLKSIKTAKGQLLGGADLECRRLDFDTGQELFEATGPGVIRLDNSKISEPNEQTGRFSFRRPCYVFLRDFATLKYFQKANQIIADAEPGSTLQIDYFPVVEGKYGQQVIATAAQTEVNLVQTTGGQTELSKLTASGAVTYNDGKKQFQGSKLLYDAGESIVTVQGDESAPCFFNGAAVDGFEWDLKTDKIEFEIAGPGALGTN